MPSLLGLKYFRSYSLFCSLYTSWSITSHGLSFLIQTLTHGLDFHKNALEIQSLLIFLREIDEKNKRENLKNFWGHNFYGYGTWKQRSCHGFFGHFGLSPYQFTRRILPILSTLKHQFLCRTLQKMRILFYFFLKKKRKVKCCSCLSMSSYSMQGQPFVSSLKLAYKYYFFLVLCQN